MLRPNQHKTLPEIPKPATLSAKTKSHGKQKENANYDTYKTPQKTVLPKTPFAKQALSTSKYNEIPKTPYRPLQDKTNKTPYVSQVLESGYKTPGGKNRQLESELRSAINPKTTGSKRLSRTHSRHSSSKSSKKFDNIESGSSILSECDDKLQFTIDNVPDVEYCPPRSPGPFDVYLKSSIVQCVLYARF